MKKNTYANSNEIVFDGMRGIDEWGYEEIIHLDNGDFIHEILLHSKAKIFIQCKDISLKG
ncbi:hypothetical protein [Niallia sp. 03133]|uniref:hypothetical protein n=1 Tax=Niallia sp. 03133 TaxID=3458060 RepID=UPI004043E66D